MQVASKANAAGPLAGLIENELPGGRGLEAWQALLRAHATLLRQLEMAMRETYFHPSKVPAGVMGDEGRAMPQQQQQ